MTTPTLSLHVQRAPSAHNTLDRFLGKIGLGRRAEPSRPSSSSSSPTPSPPVTGRPSSRASSSSRKRNSQKAPEPQSEFHRSAMAAARSGMKYEREIDEHTDMSTLTDQEIMRLMEGMDGDVQKQPLITGPVHLMAVRNEYLRGSPQVLKKIQWLQENGWDQIWRARGDGDCFYRSFTLAYLLRILYSPTPSVEAAAALGAIHETVPAMSSVGFQQDLVDEFLGPFVTSVASFVDPAPGAEPSEYSILQTLQDAEKSNSIVVALRLMTGAYIRTHPDDFAPFLFSPSTLEPVTPDAFCREEVEPCGKEADHAQIMALAAALAVPVRVAYLDRSEVEGKDVINWVEFGNAGDNNRPLTLLYRPGHFDVVTKDRLQAELQKQETQPVASGSGTQQPTAAPGSQPHTAAASATTAAKAGPTSAFVEAAQPTPTPTTTAPAPTQAHVGPPPPAPAARLSAPTAAAPTPAAVPTTPAAATTTAAPQPTPAPVTTSAPQPSPAAAASTAPPQPTATATATTTTSAPAPTSAPNPDA